MTDMFSLIFTIIMISLLIISNMLFTFTILKVYQKTSDLLLIKKAKRNNSITNGECWHTETQGVISNRYSGPLKMVATYTYKVGKNTYEHKKELYPNKEGKFNCKHTATVYYNEKKPWKCVVI